LLINLASVGRAAMPQLIEQAWRLVATQTLRKAVS